MRTHHEEITQWSDPFLASSAQGVLVLRAVLYGEGAVQVGVGKPTSLAPGFLGNNSVPTVVDAVVRCFH